MYHKNAGEDIILKDDRDEKKRKVSNFIKRNIQSPNLAFLIGSGCSSKDVDLMSKTMENILIEDETILNVVKKYHINHRIEQFISYLEDKDKDNSKLVKFIKKRNYNKISDIKDDIYSAFDFEYDELKEKLENFYKNFNDIESLLNWLQNAIAYNPNEILENKTFEDIFEELKEKFIKTIPKFNHPKYNSGETLEIYKKFYKIIFENRTEIQPKVSIFTTNYDLFNEYALEANNVSYTTGFKALLNHTFDINEFKYRIVDDTNRYKNKWQPVKKEANIFKIHGSINWYNDNNNFCQKNIENIDSKNIVIYPTILKHKETAQSPYSELFREFANRLQERNTTLIVIGYGFSDEHINNIISQNLRNPDFNLIIFGDENEQDIKKFTNVFKNNTNLHLIGGDSGRKDTKAHHFDFIVDEILGYVKVNEEDNNV